MKKIPKKCGLCGKELTGKAVAGYFGPDAERFALSVKPEWPVYFCPGDDMGNPESSSCFHKGKDIWHNPKEYPFTENPSLKSGCQYVDLDEV